MKKIKIVNKKRFTVAMIIIFSQIFLLLGFAFSQINSYTIEESTPEFYYVLKGDDLWGVAEKYKEENEDTRDYIWKIKQVNELENSKINPGEKIILPN